MVAKKRNRSLLLSIILLSVAAAGIPAAPQAPKPASAKAEAGPNDEAKCAFLRRELTRIQTAPVDIPDRVPASIRAVYPRYAAEVNLNVIQGKISSCEKKEKLSSLTRLRTLDAARLDHIDKIRHDMPGASGDAPVEAVNSLYEQEAKTFYNSDTVRIPQLDRDVVKDFPTLLQLVKSSSLPDEQKNVFTQNFRFIRYEEAGRLQNGLRGVDKDLGNTFVYLLRSDLADRAAADAEQQKNNEKKRLEDQKVSEKALADADHKAHINARISVSVTAIISLALIGFILIRRDAVTFETWLQVMEISGVILLGWVLIGMGLLTWLAEYVGLAF